jgi:DNA-binding HxlR family transcriptional regulator
MSDPQLHRTQVSILHSLRYAQSKRFNDLMRPTNHTSDTFKFHIRKLTNLGYVQKKENGEYELTPKGKEFASVLDEQKRVPKKQPKVVVTLIVTRQIKNETQYLLYKRTVNPFYGYWATMSDAVLWGETFEEAAKKRLKKHSGYEADFSVNSLARIRNYTDTDSLPAEDILFLIMEASNLRGKPHNQYAGGVPQWLSLEALLQEEKYFPSLPDILKRANKKQQTITEIDSFYPIGDF